MIKGSLLRNTYLDMLGASETGTIEMVTPGFIGTDQSVHHIVDIEHKPTDNKSFDVVQKDIKLKTILDAPLKLYMETGKQYVERTSCHTPHNGLGKQCLLGHVEQNTCCMGTSGAKSIAPCHGVCNTPDSTKQIDPTSNRQFAHSTNTTDGKYADLDSLHGAGFIDPSGGNNIQWATSKHAECMDCHHQHRVGKGTHTPADQWYPRSPINLVSGVLCKVQGEQPIWPTAWTQPTSFQTLAESTKEHQICFKCHSYWALGPTVSTGIGEIETSWTNNIVDNAGQFRSAGDIAFEFNPNNRSAHPVVKALNNKLRSYASKALQSSAIFYPWNQNIGTQNMCRSGCCGTSLGSCDTVVSIS